MDWIEPVNNSQMDDLDILGLSYTAPGGEDAESQDSIIPRREPGKEGQTLSLPNNYITEEDKQVEEKLFGEDYHNNNDDDNYISLSQSAATSIYSTSPLVTLDGSSHEAPDDTMKQEEFMMEKKQEEEEDQDDFLKFMEEPLLPPKVSSEATKSLKSPRRNSPIIIEDSQDDRQDNGKVSNERMETVTLEEIKAPSNQEAKEEEEEDDESEEMIIELPHPDALEKLYPQATKKDEEWENVLAEKPILMFEESTVAYNDPEMDDFDLSKVKIYIKKKDMIRGRNQPLSILRGATQQYLKLYRREFKRHMKILLALKEEIERHGKKGNV